MTVTLIASLEALKIRNTCHIPDKRSNALLDRCIALVKEQDITEREQLAEKQQKSPEYSRAVTSDTLIDLLKAMVEEREISHEIKEDGQVLLDAQDVYAAIRAHTSNEPPGIASSEIPVKSKQVEFEVIDSRAGMLGRDKRCPKNFTECIPAREAGEILGNENDLRKALYEIMHPHISHEKFGPDDNLPTMNAIMAAVRPYLSSPAREAGWISGAGFPSKALLREALAEVKSWAPNEPTRIHVNRIIAMLEYAVSPPKRETGEISVITHAHLEELAMEIRKAAYPNRDFTHNESFLCARAAFNYLQPWIGAPKREIVLPNDLSIKISGIVDDHATEPNLYTLSEATKDILTLIETAGLARESGKLDFLDEPKTRGAIQEVLTKYFSAADKAYGEHIGASADVIEAIRNSIEGQSS